MTTIDPDDNELRMLIQKVARRIRANRGDADVTDTQLATMMRITREGPTTPGRLADLEKVSPPSMNRTLNSLEDRGHILRTPSPDDARKVLVDLTPAARDLIAETKRLRAEWFSAHLDVLTEVERAQLRDVRDILRKLADS
ncbi:MarR family winged helix-turn-helix transcriptional regulator [Naasia lichenicola]|nr:MarR family transcriptional regulator [Naasia lichenicola]